MKTFGLIGFPLTHSFSKKYFTEKFQKENYPDCIYELFPIEQVYDLHRLLIENPSLSGLNVTIPHKINVMPLLTEIDAAAKEIGAVNCIKIESKADNQSLVGYNTDTIGFEKSLKPLLQPYHTQALILGSGGASKAVKFTLSKLGIPFKIVSRNGGDLSYSEIDVQIFQNYKLIINTTPLGMHPEVQTCPDLPYQFFTREHLAYDLVYNPEATTFLKQAAAMGAGTKNGLEMLYLQAEAAWAIWNDK